MRLDAPRTVLALIDNSAENASGLAQALARAAEFLRRSAAAGVRVEARCLEPDTGLPLAFVLHAPEAAGELNLGKARALGPRLERLTAEAEFDEVCLFTDNAIFAEAVVLELTRAGRLVVPLTIHCSRGSSGQDPGISYTEYSDAPRAGTSAAACCALL